MNSDERNWYPLIEWGLWREDCEAILRGQWAASGKVVVLLLPVDEET